MYAAPAVLMSWTANATYPQRATSLLNNIWNCISDEVQFLLHYDTEWDIHL